MKRIISLAIFLLALQPAFAQAEVANDTLSNKTQVDTLGIYGKGFFAGIEAAADFGVCTFRTLSNRDYDFSASASIIGGYRFSRFFAASLSYTFADINTSAMDCCNYWLSETNTKLTNKYAPTPDCMKYFDMTSKTKAHIFSLAPSFNLLYFFQSSRDAKWILELAPTLSAVVTKTTLDGLNSEKVATTREFDAQCHFGWGGEVSLGYAVSDNLDIRLSSGITLLTGGRFDRIPYYYNKVDGGHKENYIFDAGVKAIWHF